MKSLFYGNASTKVLHKSGKAKDACRAAEILRSNREDFATTAAAEKQGYRLCKNCFKEK